MSETRDQLIDRLTGLIHAQLQDLIGPNPVAFIDFPNIRNVGDSAIWVGEIAYLRRFHQRKPDYVAELVDFDGTQMNAVAPEATMFIHGGGNFGDIWPVRQQFRERLLQQFPDNPIVQFPQSIHYDSEARADETARIIERHRNFTLLVRDRESLEFAQRKFDCETRLCPDMALAIGPLKGGRPSLDVLAMLREDKETSNAYAIPRETDLPCEDWITENRLRVRLFRMMGRLSAAYTFDPMQMRGAKYNAAADARMRRGIKQLSRARAIVTDRLHVHIVSTLMGIPHAVLDNSYGKIRRFMDGFDDQCILTHRATSLEDAIAWARANGRT